MNKMQISCMPSAERTKAFLEDDYKEVLSPVILLNLSFYGTGVSFGL